MPNRLLNYMTDLDKQVAKHLNLLIGIYFSDVYQCRAKETLGEFIVSSKSIYPEYFFDWMKEKLTNQGIRNSDENKKESSE